jgi:group I intron endonuclease
MFKNTGVYIIENIVTNKYYIGSTSVSFRSRFNKHLGTLRRNSHHSKKLQRSYLKHGESAFKFKVLEICDGSKVRKKEQEWIDTMNPFYNMTLIVDGGVANHTYESKLKLSKSLGGKPIDICDLEGNVLKTVNFQNEAADFVKGNQSKIWKCLQGITGKHKNHRFKYAGEDFKYVKKEWSNGGGNTGRSHSEKTKEKMGPAMARGKFKGVLEVFRDSSKVGEFLSLGEAAKELNIKVQGISSSLKSGKIYKRYTFNKLPLVADSPVSGIERGFKENKNDN